ncbi:MAG TPA: FtsW/RodA/SpoVE family cell cycle protein [Methylomusa anaerophila]|nr:FtsW/RodA/SpoVE family cell cycle protein [Methylomusa anaerophila]HML87130.1 FtsW/RodA/SpoVE family cell cycle protein [Methylomusa anaerophila]
MRNKNSDTIKQERTLLIIASIILFLGWLVISLSQGKIQAPVTIAVSGLIVTWFLVHFIIRYLLKLYGDPLLLPLGIFLSAIGLTMILRLKPDLFIMQVLWQAIGLLGFVIFSFVFRQAEPLAKYKYTSGMIGIGLLLATILFGTDIGGNKNWIILGPVMFQPAEFAKLFVIIFLAAYLSERRQLLSYATRHYGPFILPHPRFIAPLIALWGLAMLMLVTQRDLGSALLFFGTTIIMTYIASGRLLYIVLAAILFIIGSFACYKLYPHVQVRIDIWLNPWVDPTGRAYQIVQSLFALGSGNVLGSGLTYGFPQFIPAVHTDFIFAAIAEELGFAGSSAVILAYIFMVYRGFKIASLARTPYTIILASGLSVLLAMQVFIIIAGVTKFLPLTGITLPLISYGGSSTVSSFILLGMLFALSEVRPDYAQ